MGVGEWRALSWLVRFDGLAVRGRLEARMMNIHLAG